MGSKRPFGWLLDQFLEGLGRIWMRLGRIWAFKIKAFASHTHFLNTLGHTLLQEPERCLASPRGASQSKILKLKFLASKIFAPNWPKV